MKKILLSLLTMMLFTGIFAQVEPPLDIDKINKQLDSVHEVIINKSDYVFEGNIIKSDIYFRNNSVICSDIIKITKVFRGNIQTGTIEVLSYSSFNMDGDQRVTWHRNSYDKFGIFFCGIAKEFQFDPKYNIDKVDNKEILTKKGRIQYSPYSGSYEGIINLKNGKITTKAELYKILKRYPNLNIPETAEKEPWDHDIITIEDFNKYLHDSINHKGAFKLPKQAVQKKDSLKNGTRP